MRLITLFLLLITLSANTFAANEKCLLAKVSGKGQAILLMPGFISDETVWTELAQSLSQHYQVHQLAIAGFGKNPACSKADDIVAQVLLETSEYLKKTKLERPIFVGHSMGGLMAFKLAMDEANGLVGAISVDGLPFIGPIFTRNNQTTVDDVRNQARGLKAMYQAASVNDLTNMTKQGIMIQTKQRDRYEDILAMASGSDPKTAGSAIYSVMTTDLRGNLAHLSTPMLLLGASGGFATPEQQRAAKDLYQQQLSNTSQVKLKMNTNGLHFLMWDDPKWLQQQIVDFAKERS